MCRYYAHHYICKHTSLSFARFCGPASLIQTPCAERHIWQALQLEEACEDCRALSPGAQDHHQGAGVGYGSGYGQGQRRR